METSVSVNQKGKIDRWVLMQEKKFGYANCSKMNAKNFKEKFNKQIETANEDEPLIETAAIGGGITIQKNLLRKLRHEGIVKSNGCFLCRHNLSEKQGEIMINCRITGCVYILLANPFPIAKRHVTITSIEHKIQDISSFSILDMLEISNSLEGYTVGFNGWGAGASINHFHFQATSFHLPIFKYDFIKIKEIDSCSFKISKTYPVAAIKFSGPAIAINKSVYEFVKILKKKGLSFNLIAGDGEVIVIPRSNEKCSYMKNALAFFEMAGFVCTEDSNSFLEMKNNSDSVISAIKECGISYEEALGIPYIK